MFGIKTRIKKRMFRRFRPSSSTFPKTGARPFALRAYVKQIKEQYRAGDMDRNLGWLSTPPHPVALWAYQQFLSANPNHLGTWSGSDTHPWGTQSLEQQSVRMMARIYGGSPNKHGGYMTSGGTEGNLYAAWLGNAFLQKQFRPKNICVIRTSLTHYSIRKAAAITNTKGFLTPLSDATWSMDPAALARTLTSLYERGYRGFLIPLTAGYTNTGTGDDIAAITQMLSQLRKKLKSIEYFVWVDAALNGLVEPFTPGGFLPFRDRLVRAVVVDFHKFGGVPYPAGMVLYQKPLQNLIEQPIDYLKHTDATVSGSRSGAAAAAVWAVIQHLGYAGFASIVHKQMDNKRYFMKTLTARFPKTEIITGPRSLTCGIIFHSLPQKTVHDTIAKRYGLFTKPVPLRFVSGTRTERVYKIYFLPHVEKRVVTELLDDMSKRYG